MNPILLPTSDVTYTMSEVLVSGEERLFFEGMDTSITRELEFVDAEQEVTDTVRVYLKVCAV